MGKDVSDQHFLPARSCQRERLAAQQARRALAQCDLVLSTIRHWKVHRVAQCSCGQHRERHCAHTGSAIVVGPPVQRREITELCACAGSLGKRPRGKRDQASAIYVAATSGDRDKSSRRTP